LRFEGGKLKMATQMQTTPTLYGKEAELLLKQISKKPSNDSIQEKIQKLEKKFEGMYKRRG
jgi:Txe/YoeB family toxin of Txe-Axe toxin-antitoxin module